MPIQPLLFDDASLVDAIRRRDETAFVQLVARYQGPLLRLARVYAKSDAVAEEIVQETWLGVLKGIDRFESRSSFKTWLFRILVNRARTRAERDARHRFDEHLAGCPFCQIYLDQMRETIRATGHLSDEAISGGALDALLAHFRRWR